MADRANTTIAELAQAYRATYAEGQRLQDEANANRGDDERVDPELLALAYEVQDEATRLAHVLARTPARTTEDVLRKVATLVGRRDVMYPSADAAIRAEALALIGGAA